MRSSLWLVWLMWPCVAWAGPTPQVPADLILWGGGTTRVEAEEWLAEWNAPSTSPKKYVELAPGFPRIDDSTTVAGLKPGFFVVTLGICAPNDSKRALQILKGMAERTYRRQVKLLASPQACPKVREGFAASKVVDTPDGDRLHLLLIQSGKSRVLIGTLRTAEGRGLALESQRVEPGDALPPVLAEAPYDPKDPDGNECKKDGLWIEIAPTRGCPHEDFETHRNFIHVSEDSLEICRQLTNTCD